MTMSFRAMGSIPEPAPVLSDRVTLPVSFADSTGKTPSRAVLPGLSAPAPGDLHRGLIIESTSAQTATPTAAGNAGKTRRFPRRNAGHVVVHVDGPTLIRAAYSFLSGQASFTRL